MNSYKPIFQKVEFQPHVGGKPFSKRMLEGKKGLSCLQALQLAAQNRFRISSNKSHDPMLLTSSAHLGLNAYPAWTGTLIAYTKPGEKFGSFVGYADSKTGERYLFSVPEEYRGESDMALALEAQHARLALEGKNILLVAIEAEKVIGLPDFPRENGWYMPDSKESIPLGEKVKVQPQARRLHRAESMVSLIARGSRSLDFYARRAIRTDIRPSRELSLFVDV